MNVGELIVQLKADASAVREGVAQAKGPLADFVAEQKKVQKATNETRDVLKKAFAVEVITAQARQVGSALSRMQGETAQFAGQMTTLTADLVQGWGQGGPLGFAIAGISAGIKAVVDEYNAVEIAAKEASDAAIAGHRAEAASLAAVGARIREASLGLKALRAAGPFGNVSIEANNLDIASARGRAESAMTGYVAAGGLTDSPRKDAEMFKEQLDKANEDLRLLGEQRNYLDEQARQERARKDPMTNLRRNDTDSVVSRRAVVDGYFAGGPQALQAAQIAAFAKRNAGGDGAADFAARRARESAEALADHTATLNTDANAWHAHIQGIADADKAQRAATVAAMDMAEALDGVGSSSSSSSMNTLFDSLNGLTTDLGDSTGYYAQQAGLGAAQSAGGGVGMIAGAIAGGPAGLAVMATQLLAGSEAFQRIQAKLGDALAQVGELLGGLVEPLEPVIGVMTDLVGVMAESLLPMFKILGPILTPVVKGLQLLGAGNVALYTSFNYLADWLQYVGGNLKLFGLWLADFWEDNDAERAALSAELESFTAGDLTDRIGNAVRKFYEDTSGTAREPIDDLGKAAEKAAGAFGGVSWYKVSDAVFRASTGSYVSGGGTATDTQRMTNGARGTVHPGTVAMAGGEVVNFNAPVTIVANSPRQLFEALKRLAFEQRGTTAGFGIGG